ncbi:MAG: hypothetical protein K2K45_00575 [Muribaculaceae bacterium]|nr:hypothetical protein [Muribaculaceae bacterium]
MIIIGLGMALFPLRFFAASPQEVADYAMQGYELFMRDSLPDDKEKGYALMLDAAWEGDAKAANNIGWLMEHGEFVGKDLKGALRWYERAADQGLPAAALNYLQLIVNHPEEALDGRIPDRERLAKTATIAGTSLLMGRGLHYDSKLGEEFLLRGALFGNHEAALTIAQQLEMYPDSFSYLPLEDIVSGCDSILPPEDKIIPEGISVTEFTDLMLTPEFWYEKIGRE